jgi:F0F1-type ATP synthase assembly protein I
MTDDTSTAASAARHDDVHARKGVLSIEREAAAGMDQGMRVLSYLLSGVIFYGALGWLGDHLLGTGFLLPIGITGGAALSVFMIIKRFGQVPDTDRPAPTTADASTRQSDTTEGAK